MSSSQESTETLMPPPTVSKKVLKKEQAKAEKALKCQQHAASTTPSVDDAGKEDDDPLAGNYSDVALEKVQSKVVSRQRWTKVVELNARMGEEKGAMALVRGHAQATRVVRKKMVFFVLRQEMFTVQYVLTSTPGEVSPQVARFTAGISMESIVDVEGAVSIPDNFVSFYSH